MFNSLSHKPSIALYNLEPNICNTALMQISQYHKQLDHRVEWYINFFHHHYDYIYCSSLFTFSNKDLVPENSIVGGTGFDINSKLPFDIENCNLDYSIYPNCKCSYIWFSRGCIRNCPFCIVREKEGFIHSVKPKNINPLSKFIRIMDNNFFAVEGWEKNIPWIKNSGLPITFDSGIDVRLFDKSHYDFLDKYLLKRTASLHIAWDNPHEDLFPKIVNLTKYFSPYLIRCYVLVGFNSTIDEDLYRIEMLRSIKVDPYVMVYDRSNILLMRLARYVNNPIVFHSTTWENYKYRII